MGFGLAHSLYFLGSSKSAYEEFTYTQAHAGMRVCKYDCTTHLWTYRAILSYLECGAHFTYDYIDILYCRFTHSIISQFTRIDV